MSTVTESVGLPDDATPTPRRSGSTLSQIGEFVIEMAIRLCGWSSILFVTGIFVFVAFQAFVVYDHGAIRLWTSLDWSEFLFGREWQPTLHANASYGTLPLLIGSVTVTGLAMIIAVPLGLGAAVFLSEFCSGKTREVLKITIELLAAIPSIVWGFIAVVVLNPLIIWATGAPVGLNVLNGGLILALMSVPVIVSVGEDALKAVPDSYREAAIALGASRWEVVYRVLFPAAKNGLLAAVLLGVGRAIGETMAVLFATGHSVNFPTTVLDPVRTLTATIAAELGEVEKFSDHYRVLFVVGLMLFAIAFIINLTSDLIVKGIKGQQNA
jgi:phosphate transport system permease protein